MTKTIIDSFWMFGLTKKRLATFCFLSISAASIEGFGVSMLLPVFQYIEHGQDINSLAGSSDSWRRLLEVFTLIGVEVTLATLLVATLVTMCMRVLIVYARQLYVSWLGQEIQHSTRSQLFDAYIAMSYDKFTNLSSGSVVNLLTTETQRASGSFAALFAIVTNIIVIVGFCFVLLLISWQLTILSIIFISIAGLLVVSYVRQTPSISHSVTTSNKNYTQIVLERIGAFRLLKQTGYGGRESHRVLQRSLEVRDLSYSLSRVGARVDLIMEPFILLSGGAVIYFSFQYLGMTLSEMGVFGLILLRLLPLGKEVMRSRQTFNACMGSLSAVINGHKLAASAKERVGGNLIFEGVKRQIELNKLFFTYPGTSVPVLKDINIIIPQGKITALVGPSGAGKSTLVDMITLMHRPQVGKVLFDGVDACDFNLESVRRQIAFVSQEATVFNDTLAANLRFVKANATDEELWRVLTLAKADEFVRKMDAGLLTIVGERGVRLSGGQKQRLSLARALLQSADLLILDEPTSSLDSETEQGIQRALEYLRREVGSTILIIAHRLSTVQSADQIVVLVNGEVCEQGTHDQLVDSDDWYSRISDMQSLRGD